MPWLSPQDWYLPRLTLLEGGTEVRHHFNAQTNCVCVCVCVGGGMNQRHFLAEQAQNVGMGEEASSVLLTRFHTRGGLHHLGRLTEVL